MGARALKPAAKVMHVGAVDLHGKLVVGATGAVTSFNGYGFDSITRNSAGQYTLVLSDVWKLVTGFNANFLHTSDVNGHCQLESEDVDNPTTASRTIVIQCYNLDDSAALDPPSGSILYLKLSVQNSNLGMGPTLT